MALRFAVSALTGFSMFYRQKELQYLLNLIDTPVCGGTLRFAVGGSC
jgi:hypothetical protein